MKCDAGVEVRRGEDCPKCGVGPQGPCAVGYQRDMEELARLRAALEKIADPLLLEVDGTGLMRAIRVIRTCQTIAKAALSGSVVGGVGK